MAKLKDLLDFYGNEKIKKIEGINLFSPGFSIMQEKKPILLGFIGKKEDVNNNEANESIFTYMAFFVSENAQDIMKNIEILKGIRTVIIFPHGDRAQVVLENNENMSIISSQPMENYDAHIYTVADRYLLGNLIFLPKHMDKEEENNYLNKKIHEVIAKYLPLPVEEEWGKDFFKAFKKEFLEELLVVGKTPFKKVYILNIDIDQPIIKEKLEKLLIESYGANNFKKLFKRAPQFKPLLHMINEKNFNMKTWGNFVKSLSGKNDVREGLEYLKEKFNYRQLVWLVYLYEIFQDKGVEVFNKIKEILSDPFSVDLKTPAIIYSKEGREIQKDLIYSNFKNLVNSEGINLVILNAILQGIVKYNKKLKMQDLMEELAKTKYKIKRGAEGLALVASELMLPEDHFNEYQEAYLNAVKKAITAPRSIPLLKGQLDKEYSWEVIDCVNPRSWFVGLETNCCQHLHSAGASCVLYMADNPDHSAIFRVMKKGRTIAQSWIWFKNGTLCFDNIEVLGGEVRESIKNCYLQYVEQLEKYAPIFNIEKVTVGLGYNDMESFTSQYPTVTDPVILNDVYTDAHHQVLIRDFSSLNEEKRREVAEMFKNLFKKEEPSEKEGKSKKSKKVKN
jgi:hypothetical protein